MLRAVIFDFDGVIVDSESLHLSAFNSLLAQFGADITTENYYENYLGLTDFDYIELLSRKNKLGFSDRQIKDLIKQKNQIFKELAKTKACIIEGVRPFLDMLHRNNIPMAVCSGALLVEIEPILEQSRLRSFFEVIVSAELVKKGKPAPDGFLLALRELNKKSPSSTSILSGQCIAIEDSHWGLEAANAAGMHTIAATNSYNAEQLTMAEKIVTRLDQLSMEDLQELCD